MKYVIFGNGYLGNKFKHALGDRAELVITDIANITDVRDTLSNIQPDVVINCAGVTGSPNIDWCESHKDETMYANVTGPLVLARVCADLGVFMVHLGSGCIYQGDNHGNGFSEDDVPSIETLPSFYSYTKYMSEHLLKQFPILQCRLRMPLDSEKNPRNFITKITTYEKVISEPNSVTVIEDLIRAVLQLIDQRKTGIYNITNPGTITHKEILDLYTQIVDPTFSYTLIPTDALHTCAGRSNCVLNTDKLAGAGVMMTPIREAIIHILKNYH
jgi:dTDP-4-dehydrorhamnose reductase